MKGKRRTQRKFLKAAVKSLLCVKDHNLPFVEEHLRRRELPRDFSIMAKLLCKLQILNQGCYEILSCLHTKLGEKGALEAGHQF